VQFFAAREDIRHALRYAACPAEEREVLLADVCSFSM
jgi:hypothetical protein